MPNNPDQPRHFARRMALLVTAVAMIGTSSSQFLEAAVVVDNGHMRVAFDSSTGALTEISDVATSHNLITHGPASGGIWNLSMRTNAQDVRISPSDAAEVTCRREADVLRVTWSDFRRVALQDLEVDVSVALEPDSVDSKWNIAVRGLGEHELAEVRFPRIENVAPIEGEHLAVPQWMGMLTSEPRRLLTPPSGHPVRMDWRYPGLMSLQCLAVYGKDTPGLYFACDDPNAFGKNFAVFGETTGSLCLEQTHLLEHNAGRAGHWQMPYQSIVGVLHGDWFTAAERYRTWASQQTCAKQSRLRQGLVPEWLRDCDLWVWNRGRSSEVLEPAVALKKQLGSPVGVFWHWWHGCSYDAGFPEYFPPREGEESFKAAIKAAHEQQVHAILYMNQRLWGMTTQSWKTEGSERFAVKGPDGKVAPEVYNTFTKQPCASMCMGTSFWRNTYSGLAQRGLRELGADGIYMDQACSSLACYDSSHGHPLGGGSYWIEGFRQLAADIRQQTGGNGAKMLAGEGCSEAWLPYLDLMLSLEVSRERYTGLDGWEPIPFFHAVYHDKALMYGNYSSLTSPPYDELWPPEKAPKEPLKLLDRKFSRQFALEQARSFVWGQQLTISNFKPEHLKTRTEEIELVVRLAKLRRAATKYLRDGVLLRPPVVTVDDTTIPMSRLSIYAGRAEGGVTAFEKLEPQVLASAWRAPDNSVGIALASTADAPLTVPLKLDAAAYDLHGPTQAFRIDEQGRTELSGLKRASDGLQVQLPPRGACVIEIKASAHQ